MERVWADVGATVVRRPYRGHALEISVVFLCVLVRVEVFTFIHSSIHLLALIEFVLFSLVHMHF